MKKILYFNTNDQEDLEIENRIAAVYDLDVQIELVNHVPDEDLIERGRDANGIVAVYTPFDREAIERLPALEVISLQSIGTNTVDLTAAAEHGICVTNIPDYCVNEVAVHTMALALSCIRQIPRFNARVRSGNWEYSDITLHRVRGLVFGMIAFGNIPREMVPMIRGMGMIPLVYAPTKSEEEVAAAGAVKAADLETLLTQADIVSMHLPLKEDTKDFMGEKEFSLMKKSAYFINTSRGGVVDEEAAYHALSTGEIAGAALDVLKDERHFTSPLLSLDNVLVTPHVGFYSEDSLLEARERAIIHVLDVLSGKKPDNAVKG